ncbi:MAG TPA: SDR family oxidoreductase [Acidimicrobiia bacterium]|jgi:NAD(P)-dependent dehydrogenase (short-subunit alcohol dehydrogenase family)|nr:SDR family oxidoreductase [Acidimicrobiia bacterium]
MSERRAAVVTGGASGIGRATVERFLVEGWSVVAADLNAENGEALVADLEAAGHKGRIVFVRVDISREEDVAATVGAAADRFGRLDCMVNNAGVGGAFGPITELEVEDWDYTFAVLTRSVLLGIKHAARLMLAGGRPGSIVNTASIAGLGGGAGPQAYSAAKAAVLNLTRTTAVELAPHRIRVNAVNPGAVRTPLAKMARLEDLAGDAQPWPEVGQPAQVASVIYFLAGDDAGFITGESITVDGGTIAAGPRLRAITDAGSRGLVGVNRGTTGQESLVRRRHGPKRTNPADEGFR